jgi:hypothetical protein
LPLDCGNVEYYIILPLVVVFGRIERFW